MKNHVIKAMTDRQANMAIEYFINHKSIAAFHFSKDNCIFNPKRPYYGYINGLFGNYSIREVSKYNAEIIDLQSNGPEKGDITHVNN